MGNHKAWPRATVPHNGPGARGTTSWQPSVVRHGAMPSVKRRAARLTVHRRVVDHFGHSRALAHLDGYDARG